jgi:hypothetical protein
MVLGIALPQQAGDPTQLTDPLRSRGGRRTRGHAKGCNELATPHSITSWIVGGMLRAFK